MKSFWVWLLALNPASFTEQENSQLQIPEGHSQP